MSTSTLPNYKDLRPESVITDLQVIDLIVDSAEFDHMFKNYDEDISISGRLFTYRNQLSVLSNEEIEIEIKGRTTNYHSLKSLGITFEQNIDNSNGELLYASHILPHHHLDKIKSFRLRNSGNDYSKTMLKDLSYSMLATQANLHLDALYGESVMVFVNSSFYGILNLRTETNTKGLSRLFEVDENDISLCEVVHHKAVPLKGDMSWINLYLDAIENEDLDYLKTHTDLTNFIDYVIFETYIANSDWPYINVRFYSIDHQPFRFILFDMDLCNTIHLNKEPLYFVNPPDIETPVSSLFTILYNDPDFKSDFDLRYQEILNSKVLSYDNFASIVDENASLLEPIIQLQIDCHGSPYSKIEWMRQVELVKDHFRVRTEYFD